MMNQFFFKHSEDKSFSLPTPSTILDWKHDQEHFLSAVRAAIASGQMDDLAAQWTYLCQQYSHQRTLTEWEFLFRTLHAHCQEMLAHATPTNIPAPEEEKHRQQELTHAWLRALPSVMPMQWQIIACADKAEADTHIQILSASKSVEGPPSPPPTSQTCTLLYWLNGDNLHCRYIQAPQKPLDVDVSSLLKTATLPSHPDPIVENILGIFSLQGTLSTHPQLTLDTLRILLTHLQQQKRLILPPPKEEDEKPRRIIRQTRTSGAVYHGQWFTPPLAPEPAITSLNPLPGSWITVYPKSSVTLLEITDSQGWVRLVEPTHRYLLELLRRNEAQETRQRRQQTAHQLCGVYTDWESSIKQYLPPSLQVSWYLTTAEAAAQQQRWLPPISTTSPQPPTAIKQSCIALALCEQVDSSGAATTNVESSLNVWMNTQTQHSLQRLLPQYQQQLHAALEPLQRDTGKLSLADLQCACHAWRQLLPLLSWLNPSAAKAAYVIFNQACEQRQNDILMQIQALVVLPKPTLEQQQTCQDWQAALQTLLQTWEENGYQTLAEHWKESIRRQIPALSLPDISSAQDQVLTLLEQGLATLAPSEAKTAVPLKSGNQPILIPATWEQAHQMALNGLRRYALQQQQPAFQQLKRRYYARLSSYQALCEQLSHTQPGYATLAAWCKTHVAELKTLTLAQCIDTRLPPMTWPWQSLRRPSPTVTPNAWLQQVCAHLEKLLPPTLCGFEVLGMQSNTQPITWRIHLLIANPAHCNHEYFAAYQQLLHLYQALLPTQFLPLALSRTELAAISVTTPKTLAHKYCPLWQSGESRDETPASYLPVFHHTHSITQTLDQPQ